METINYSENPKMSAVTSSVSPGELCFPEVCCEEKKPITKELKSLVVGGSVSFPIERRSSVLATAQRLKKDLVRIGWNFKIIDNTEDFTVTVVRVP